MHLAKSSPCSNDVPKGLHVLHDGYTDLIYIMLTIWQTQFGIGYAWLGVMLSGPVKKVRTNVSASHAGFEREVDEFMKLMRKL